jgi:hypothetical protein
MPWHVLLLKLRTEVSSQQAEACCCLFCGLQLHTFAWCKQGTKAGVWLGDVVIVKQAFCCNVTVLQCESRTAAAADACSSDLLQAIESVSHVATYACSRAVDVQLSCQVATSLNKLRDCDTCVLVVVQATLNL